MKRQFLPLQKAIKLEEVGGILSSLELNKEIVYVIGMSENEEDENIYFSSLLQELVVINKRRREILDIFKAAKI